MIDGAATTNAWTLLLPVAAIGLLVFALAMTAYNRIQIRRRLNLLAMRPHSPRRAAASPFAGDETLAAHLSKGLSRLGRLLPLGASDRKKIEVNLQRAGLTNVAALTVVLGLKLVCLVVGLVVGILAVHAILPEGVPSALAFPAAVVGGLLLGVLLNIVPEFVLARIAAGRLLRIKGSLSECFDLLIICLESGITFERALQHATDQLKYFQPDLAVELRRGLLAMRVGNNAADEALRAVASRLDCQEIQDLASVIGQSERHGTPVADALRKLAGSHRTRVSAEVQSRIARLPTLLTLPSIGLLLPGIMVILGGPAVLQFGEITSGLVGG